MKNQSWKSLSVIAEGIPLSAPQYIKASRNEGIPHLSLNLPSKLEVKIPPVLGSNSPIFPLPTINTLLIISPGTAAPGLAHSPAPALLYGAYSHPNT